MEVNANVAYDEKYVHYYDLNSYIIFIIILYFHTLQVKKVYDLDKKNQASQVKHDAPSKHTEKNNTTFNNDFIQVLIQKSLMKNNVGCVR